MFHVSRKVYDYIGAYYTYDDEDDDIYGGDLSDVDYYLRLLKDEVTEFVEGNETELITDLFVDEFKTICTDENACNEILNDGVAHKFGFAPKFKCLPINYQLCS